VEFGEGDEAVGDPIYIVGEIHGPNPKSGILGILEPSIAD